MVARTLVLLCVLATAVSSGVKMNDRLLIFIYLFSLSFFFSTVTRYVAISIDTWIVEMCAALDICAKNCKNLWALFFILFFLCCDILAICFQ